MKLRSPAVLPSLLFTFAAVAYVPPMVAQTEDLSVLAGWVEWSDAANRLQHQLNSAAMRQLEKRSFQISGLTSAEAWRTRQAEVRTILEKVVGPFPDKGPLNPRILGTLKKEGYSIEKVVFESRPKFYVTGCLFLPAQRSSKSPAILNVIGHTDIAFRSPFYQHLILNLVRKGFIVFAVDPVGQGERLQYFDPELQRSLVGGSTAEHSYFGRQCFLTGSSAARYFVWDGIRAIDYLVSRPEVDPDRIGVTGISGGGTQTSYIAALDDRVVAAAPTCYIAGFRRLLESIGPQDAEQNLNEGLLHGIDHADYLEVRAPRPTMVVSTTRDFFSIQGARETYAEAKMAFRMLGAGDNLSMVEDDFGHGYTKKTLEAIYRFFQQYLKNPGSPDDEDLEVLPIADLTVTKTGQVSDSLGGESVFSLNRAEAQALAERLDVSRRELKDHLERVRNDARRIVGFRSPEDSKAAIFRGRETRSGYTVEKYALRGDGGSPLPVLLFLPESGSKHRALIYLNPQGKSAAAAPGAEMEQLLKRGYAVLAPDLSGTGELGQVNDAIAFLGVLTGRTVVGLRAADISQCVRFLRSRPDVDGDDIGAVARGGLAIPLLHAALFEDAIRKIALVEPLVSLQSVVMNRYYNLDAGALITNVLAAYDLPDLEAALAPRRLALIDVVDQLQKPVRAELLESAFDVVRRSYADRGAGESLSIRFSRPGQPLVEALRAWLR